MLSEASKATCSPLCPHPPVSAGWDLPSSVLKDTTAGPPTAPLSVPCPGAPPVLWLHTLSHSSNISGATPPTDLHPAFPLKSLVVPPPDSQWHKGPHFPTRGQGQGVPFVSDTHPQHILPGDPHPVLASSCPLTPPAPGGDPSSRAWMIVAHGGPPSLQAAREPLRPRLGHTPSRFHLSLLSPITQDRAGSSLAPGRRQGCFSQAEWPRLL